MNTPLFSLRLCPTISDRVKRVATTNDVSCSEIARQALIAYLNWLENTPPDQRLQILEIHRNDQNNDER